MDNNYHITNRQKLLFMVQELHKRGFGKLGIIPSLSPSGMHWRCTFIDETKSYSCIASNWIHNHVAEHSMEEIKLTTNEFANLFIKENIEFIERCRGRNEAYEKWYVGMLEQLTKDELPYAIADWLIPKGVWQTSKGNEIKTLPNDQDYYF